MKDKFSINKFGIKLLHESSKSYETYSLECINLEFFLIYITLAEHPNIQNKKQFIKDAANKNDNDIINIEFINFIESEKSDLIFSLETYEIYFGQIAYTRIVDNALSYLKDIMVEVVRKRPEILRSGEKESLEYIFSFDSMENLITSITEKKVNELFYGNIIDITKFFNDKLGIKLFKTKVIEKNFNLFIKQRNLITHNRGIITKEFSKEFSNNTTKYIVGNKISFKYENLSIINGQIINIMAELDLMICEKFKLDTIVVI